MGINPLVPPVMGEVYKKQGTPLRPRQEESCASIYVDTVGINPL